MHTDTLQSLGRLEDLFRTDTHLLIASRHTITVYNKKESIHIHINRAYIKAYKDRHTLIKHVRAYIYIRYSPIQHIISRNQIAASETVIHSIYLDFDH